MRSVGDFLKDERRLIEELRLGNVGPDRLRAVLVRTEEAARDLEEERSERRRRLLRRVVHCVTLQPDAIMIEIKRSGLAGFVSADQERGFSNVEAPIQLIVPIVLKRRGVEAKLVIRTAEGKVPMPGNTLIALLTQAHRWFGELVAGKVFSSREIARREGFDPGDLARPIQLAFLAPEIIEAILAGRQPVESTPLRLRRIGTQPLCWDRQRRLLGFSA